MLRFLRGRVAVACAITALAALPAHAAGGSFSIAVVPDTQNMIDYKHQRADGFPIDASELFLGEMRWIAERAGYSPHYKAFADELATYAAWYKAHEAPDLDDKAFAAKDAFSVTLTDFRARFGAPR